MKHLFTSDEKRRRLEYNGFPGTVPCLPNLFMPGFSQIDDIEGFAEHQQNPVHHNNGCHEGKEEDRNRDVLFKSLFSRKTIGTVQLYLTVMYIQFLHMYFSILKLKKMDGKELIFTLVSILMVQYMLTGITERETAVPTKSMTVMMNLFDAANSRDAVDHNVEVHVIH